MWLLLYGIIMFPFINSQKNNVCKTIPDYKTLEFNKNCYYNPNVLSNLQQIVKRNGYPIERHTIITNDGYILTAYRLFDSNSTRSHKRQPVIVQHGLAGSAVFWVLQNRKSIAFFLYDNGYDVWLPTIRGAIDSREHVSLSNDDPTYWNFGIHEMGTQDLPAIVDYISNKKLQKGNIIYIGHSMGTSMSYIYSSIMKEHAEQNLKAIISFAPIAYMAHIRGLYAILAPFADIIKNLLNSIGIFALGNIPVFNRLIQGICSTYPTIIVCVIALVYGSGFAFEQTAADLMPVLTSYFPSGVSLQTIEHFAQIINNGGHFRQFDYGKKNLLKYNSTIPPEYEVWKITLPNYLFIGKEDFLAPKKDAEILTMRLNSSRTVENYIFELAHNDFFIGKHLQKLHSTLLQVLKKIGNT